MPRNTGQRTLVYVSTALSSGNTSVPIKYVFRSGLPSTLRSDFGQTLVGATFKVDGAVFASNNFKPARANLFRGASIGYDGSFCSDNKVKELKDQGASIRRKRFQPYAISGKAGSNLYYATINGLKIGYRVNAATLPTGFAAQTGLTLATSSDVIVMGAQFPLLGEAIYSDPSTGKAQSFACSPSKYNNLSGNWSQGRKPLSTQDDFKNLFGI